MPLKIVLKSGEKLLVGTSKILVSSDSPITLIIEGEMPVMKEHEAISANDAISAEQKLNFHVQQLYLTGADVHKEEIGKIVAGAGGWPPAVNQMLVAIEQGAYYTAVKAARRLLNEQS